MSFNFGTPATTAPAPGFSFGVTTTANFGAPQTSAPAFGAPQTSAPTFGAPQTNAPAFGAPQTNAPTFGAPQTNAPAFGAPQTNASAFGAPQTTPAFGAPQTNAPVFGTPQQTTAPAFGGFTTIPSSQPPPSFGATSFGVAAATTTAPPSFGFTASAPTTQPAAFGNFGFPTTSQSMVPTFGSTVPATTTTSGLNFTSKPVTASVTFGATTIIGGAVPTFGLGTSTATVNPSLTATPATTGTGFSFGASTGQLSFAPTATTTTSLGGGGIFGLKSTPGLTFNTTTSSGAFGTGTVTTSTAPQSAPKTGLGGFDVNASQPKTVEGRSESVRAKDAQLPQEITSTVDMLKLHIKQQKTISSDIARTSTRKLFNVSKEIQNCDLKLSEISNNVENNYAAIKSLRSETAGAIRQAEMAQRTHGTPAGLQFENTAPLQYFMELVQKFESDMITFRNQVALTEKHIRSLTNPQSFTAEDLKRGLIQMHESFVALSGRVHEIHQKVETLKDQYLNLRKHKLKDSSNVFEETHATNNNKSSSTGPTPFSTLVGTNLSMSYAPTQASWSQHTQDNIFGVGQSNFSIQSSTTGNAFGSLNASDGGFSLSLQKPPLGLKRNKH